MRNFVPFLLILFLIAAVLRVDFFFTIVYLFSAVYVLSRLWTQRTVNQLSVRRHFTDHAFSGDQVAVDVTVQNGGWLPIPWLEVRESLPVGLTAPPFHRQVLSLGPREQHHLRYTLHCRRRGYYPIGPLTMQTGDLLGIVRHRQLQVAQLLVKQYQPAISRETLICLDLDREDYGKRQRYTASELAIVVAASIASHVIFQEGLPVGLTTEAWDPLLDEQARFFLPPRSERTHLMGLLEVLARVQLTAGTSFADVLRRESVHLSWGATLTVVTGRESETLFDTLVYLQRAGFAVALILVQPAHPSASLQKRADLLGVPVHRVWAEQELEAWR
jgi:uncharacterized protein (DUF58 family)